MEDEFDFIIVGAGSAGCVLANRLSADPGTRVLLVEAGPPDANPLIRVPLVAGLVYFWRPINWNYTTRPQAHLDGRALAWPRGKVLGGSSSINGMMYVRGHRRDYDGWRQLGLDGWAYEDVLPYFIRSEGHVDRTGPYHGTDGPFRVRRAEGASPLYRAFLESGWSAGFSRNDDFNGADQEGLGLYDFNIRDGRRESTATAYLRPARRRSNLSVWTRSLVHRLILDGRQCTGVAVDRGNGITTVWANREVILAGGAVNSPALLQHSGIGDPEHLAALDLPVANPLPGVGRNLQDHLGVYLTYRCAEPITLYSMFRPDRALRAGLQAWLFGSGPATSIPLEAGGFLRTRPEIEIPDIHITFVPGLNLETTREGQGQHGYLINFYQLRPESRGNIGIVSPYPEEPPAIDPNYLSDPADVACMRDGVRLARRIGSQEPLKRYDDGRISPVDAVSSDEQIDEWVRAGANTIFHPVGTCAMGNDDDAMAVVDAQLKVRGMQGLRVADASVMPRIIGGNTSAPTVMIAEKAADMILGRPAPPRIDLGPAAA